jgi:hypothetical protein
MTKRAARHDGLDPTEAVVIVIKSLQKAVVLRYNLHVTITLQRQYLSAN